MTRGPFIQLGSGRKFYLLDPRPHEVHIADIARSLSRLPRYTGHFDGAHYSVAEHSVLMARVAPRGLELEALLHDAAEAYVGDCSAPLKAALRIVQWNHGGLSSFDLVEESVDLAIRERFALPYRMRAEVKALDNRITADERLQLFPQSDPREWWPNGDEPEPLGVTLERWEPRVAEAMFLDLFEQLCAEAA